MGVLLDDGLRYPFRADRPLDLFAVGGILGIAAAMALQFAVAAAPTPAALVVLIPGVLAGTALLGYLSRVFAATVAGTDGPPGFRPIAGLLRSGARLLVVSVCYALPPLAIVVVTIVGLVSAPFSADALGFTGSLLFFAGSTVTLLLVVAFGYGYPVAVGRLAESGRLRSAVDLRTHRPILGHWRYAACWTFAALLVVPGWALLVTALSSATAVGVVAVFATFYAHVVATRIVARGYRDASEASEANETGE